VNKMRRFTRNLISMESPPFGQDNFFLEDIDFEDVLIEELGDFNPPVETYFNSSRPDNALNRAVMTAFLGSPAGKWASSSPEIWNLLLQLGITEFTKRYDAQVAAGQLTPAASQAVYGAQPVFATPTAAKAPVVDTFWSSDFGKAIASDPNELAKFNRLGKEEYLKQLKLALDAGIRAPMPEYEPPGYDVSKGFDLVAKETALSVGGVPAEIIKKIAPQLKEIIRLLELSKLQTDATNEHRMLVQSDNFRKQVLKDLNKINTSLPVSQPLNRIAKALRAGFGI
jgi:hypothetical protein